MIPFTQYAMKYNRVCICYSGMIPDYAAQLNILIPAVKECYEHIDFQVCVRDEFVPLVPNAIPLSRWAEVKSDYYHIKDIKTDPNGEHPIWKLVKSSPLVFKHEKPRERGSLCLVCPDAAYPSKPLTDLQVKRVISMITCEGCTPVIIGSDLHPSYKKPDRVLRSGDKSKYIDDASWVVGAENEYVFMAAARGVKTILIPTGHGTDFFKMMFPNGEINGRI